jgi:hypothetical protein
MDRLWARVRPDIGTATHAQRPKLLLLSAYIGAATARRVSYLWWALSRAGHHHCYELGMTAPELLRLRNELVELIELMQKVPSAPSSTNG